MPLKNFVYGLIIASLTFTQAAFVMATNGGNSPITSPVTSPITGPVTTPAPSPTATPSASPSASPAATPSAQMYYIEAIPSTEIFDYAPTEPYSLGRSIQALLKDSQGKVVIDQRNLKYEWTVQKFDNDLNVELKPLATCSYGVLSPCPEDQVAVAITKVGTTSSFNVNVTVSDRTTGQVLATKQYNFSFTSFDNFVLIKSVNPGNTENEIYNSGDKVKISWSPNNFGGKPLDYYNVGYSYYKDGSVQGGGFIGVAPSSATYIDWIVPKELAGQQQVKIWIDPRRNGIPVGRGLSNNYFKVVLPIFTDLSTTFLYPGPATFKFNYGYRNLYMPNFFVINASTLPDMSWDVYWNFAWGQNSTITLNNPTKWDKYSCGRTLYWQVRNIINGDKSQIQQTKVDCSIPTSIVKGNIYYLVGRNLVIAGRKIKLYTYLPASRVLVEATNTKTGEKTIAYSNWVGQFNTIVKQGRYSIRAFDYRRSDFGSPRNLTIGGSTYFGPNFVGLLSTFRFW